MSVADLGKALLLPVAFVAFATLAGCEEEGAMEKAGEQMDEAAEEMQEGMEDTMDDMAR